MFCFCSCFVADVVVAIFLLSPLFHSSSLSSSLSSSSSLSLSLSRPHVVDVGMNEGFFSLLSASLGANVLAFDMNPICFPAMEHAINLNSFENSIELR